MSERICGDGNGKIKSTKIGKTVNKSTVVEILGGHKSRGLFAQTFTNK